jgi:uncharacterized protein
MAATVPVIRSLDPDRCKELLAQACVGRVAVVVNGVPEVTPVNYGLLDGDVVFRSGTGTKLHAALTSQPVSFEVDRIDEDRRVGWSVLVSGESSVIDDDERLVRAEALDIDTWAPGTKDAFVCVRADLVLGREISRP